VSRTRCSAQAVHRRCGPVTSSRKRNRGPGRSASLRAAPRPDTRVRMQHERARHQKSITPPPSRTMSGSPRTAACSSARGLAPGLHRLVARHGANGSRSRWSICAQRIGDRALGQVRLRADARVSLGILLAPQEENRKVPFGEHYGEARGRRCGRAPRHAAPADRDPGRYRNRPRSNSSAISARRASLYDMRNLFQSMSRKAVTSGRWSICCKIFGRDGREEADGFAPRSGSDDAPRMLGASTRRRRLLSFFMFTYFTTATARCSCTRWRSPASIRCRVPAASC